MKAIQKIVLDRRLEDFMLTSTKLSDRGKTFVCAAPANICCIHGGFARIVSEPTQASIAKSERQRAPLQLLRLCLSAFQSVKRVRPRRNLSMLHSAVITRPVKCWKKQEVVSTTTTRLCAVWLGLGLAMQELSAWQDQTHFKKSCLPK